MNTHNNSQNEEQIEQCVELLQRVLKEDLLGVYLYGSAVTGGLKAFSDLDLFVISKRNTSEAEKEEIAKELLKISGVYKKSKKRPIELLIVVQSQVNPWSFPPCYDLMYGEWLRDDLESENFKLWEEKEMPDLAILITQLLLSHKTLWGPSPKALLSEVPREDILKAMKASSDERFESIKGDTRNVLLTQARIWVYLELGEIYSKPNAAEWVLGRLPTEHHASLQKAKSVCLGEKEDIWEEDLSEAIECGKFIKNTIERLIQKIGSRK
jgi:predicted nucleotidyltransferase